MPHLEKAVKDVKSACFVGSSETTVSPKLQKERKLELVIVQHVFSSCVFQPR